MLPPRTTAVLISGTRAIPCQRQDAVSQGASKPVPRARSVPTGRFGAPRFPVYHWRWRPGDARAGLGWIPMPALRHATRRLLAAARHARPEDVPALARRLAADLGATDA